MKFNFDIILLIKALVFQVTQQSVGIDKHLRGINYISSNGWRIESNKSPNINFQEKIIGIRGSNKKKDLKPIVIWNIDHLAMKRYKEDIADALYEFKVYIEDRRNGDFKNRIKNPINKLLKIFYR